MFSIEQRQERCGHHCLFMLTVSSSHHQMDDGYCRDVLATYSLFHKREVLYLSD